MKNFVMSLLVLLSITANANELPAEVSTLELENGQTVLTNAEGLSIYTFDLDSDGISNCHGQCLIIWPAITTEAEELAEPFGIHLRADGVKQITFNDSPLYLFFQDKKAGDILGDGFNGTWHLIEVE